MTKKKIVMLNSMSFLPYQGRYLRIYNEARTLAEAGHDVTLLAWDREGKSPARETVDGVRVERILLKADIAKGPLHAYKHLFFNLRALAGVWRRPADVVHCFNLDTVPAGLLAAKLRRRKITLDLCEPNYYMYWSRKQLFLAKVIGQIERITSPLYDRVFVHNLYQVRKYRSWGCDRVVQISSVPDRRMILENLDERQAARRDKVVIGRIGMVYPTGGIEETVAAFKLLLERGNPVRLLIAGKVREDWEGEFQRLIEPIRDHVEVTGQFDVSEMPSLYRKIDLSVQLHQRTPWFQNITPTKLFESLGNGVPVVASDIGDYRELIERYPCGVVVDETDPVDICEKIEGLLKDPDTIQRMAQRGLDLVHKEYCWPVMAERLKQAYEEL